MHAGETSIRNELTIQKEEKEKVVHTPKESSSPTRRRHDGQYI